ncbi:MAG: hypothetical protein PHG81_08120 [Aliarcobacter sp.]|nr:hypothetical protein [Aliarcobacter sp.]
MKNKLLKLIPIVSIVVFYSLSDFKKKEITDYKSSNTKIEQLEIKHLASEELLGKIASHEIETSWLNASIISVEKNNSNSKWIVIFKNNENNTKEKELNIFVDYNKLI